MAAVMPQTRPWTIPLRGSSDGVKERHAKTSAPQQPGSVTYSSLRRFAGSGAGNALSAAPSGGGASAAPCSSPSATTPAPGPAWRERPARPGGRRPGREAEVIVCSSANFPGGLQDGLVDVLRIHVEFLGRVLLGLQSGLFQGLLQLALPDDDQRGLSLVDDLPELLDVGPGHATPQVAAYPADGRAHKRGADDRRREQNADEGAGGGAAPRAMPGGRLVLADMDLARVVLGDHGGVIGPDGIGRVEVLDDVVVVLRRRLVRVGADVDEDCFGFCHVSLLRRLIRTVRSQGGEPGAAREQAGSKPGTASGCLPRLML